MSSYHDLSLEHVSQDALSQDIMDKRIRDKAVEYLYQNMPTLVAGQILVPLLTLFALWSQANHALLIAWTALSLSIACVRYYLYRRFNAQREHIQEPQRWANYFAVTSFIIGMLNGGAFVLFMNTDSFGSQAFMLAIIVGYTAGAIITNAYWLISTYLLAFPVLGLSAMRLFYEGGVEYNSTGALMLFYLLLAISYAKRTNRSLYQTIRLQIENQDLATQFQRQKERAEAANLAKSKFLAAASHDLRQPLHSMGLFASLLEKQLETNAQAELFGHLTHSLDALRELLNTLLDVSKLDAGAVQKNIRHFCLQSVLSRLHTEFLPQAQHKHLAFSCPSEQRMIAKSDPALLELILRNLISNAIRYTEQGGVSVEVSDTHDRQLNISVIDSGIGIPQDKQQAIFQEFHQLGNPERDRNKGLGLGLSIVKRLIELLQHDIRIESKPGSGSRFSVIVPIGDARKVMPDNDEAELSAPAILLDQVAVIFIDDEDDIRQGMQKTLAEWGCDVRVAASQQQALDCIRDESFMPQIIIADFRLREDKTGAQAIQAIEKQVGRAIPALLITGDTAPQRIREAQASGYALLHKPVHPAQILAFIRGAVSQAQAQAQTQTQTQPQA